MRRSRWSTAWRPHFRYDHEAAAAAGPHVIHAGLLVAESAADSRAGRRVRLRRHGAAAGVRWAPVSAALVAEERAAVRVRSCAVGQSPVTYNQMVVDLLASAALSEPEADPARAGSRGRGYRAAWCPPMRGRRAPAVARDRIRPVPSVREPDAANGPDFRIHDPAASDIAPAMRRRTQKRRATIRRARGRGKPEAAAR